MLRRRIACASGTWLCLILLLATTAAASTAEPAGSTSWQVAGQIGGPTSAVAVQGNYAYVGAGLRLVVLDVTNPVTPTEVGSTPPFPYFVEDIAVSGTRAYAAAGGAGLRLVDISDPANPAEIGAWDSPGYAEGVAVAGNTVYLADGPYGLRMVDVSNPAHPIPLGAAYDMNYAFDVAVEGNYAYIAAAGAGLLIADVSDPAHPLEAGTLDTPGYAYGVAVSGNTAYVADGWEGVRVVSVPNPSAPTEVSTYRTPGRAFDVAVSGSLACVADAFGGMRLLDVSDPGRPMELASLSLGRGHAGSVIVEGGIAYVADRTWGLRLVDISNPAVPSEIGAYSPMGYADSVAVSGDYAYVAAGGQGLRIVDVSDAGHPVEIGAATLPDPNDTYATAVAVLDGYAYVGVGGWLYVADVSDLTRPRWTGKVLVGEVRDMTVVGAVAYVAESYGLQLVSLSDPAHPVTLGRVDFPHDQGNTVAVAVNGSLAYVASEGEGFSVVDVSNPNDPALLSTSPIFAEDVDVAGGWAYVVDRAGLSVLDISDPLKPAKVSFVETKGTASRVTVSGTMAYVADGGQGLAVIDVSDDYHPAVVAEVNTPGYTLETAVADSRVFLSDGSSGLAIFQSSASGSSTTQQAELRASRVSVPHVRATSIRVGIQAAQSSSEAATTIIVSSPLDSGPGTLRQALLDVAAGGRIAFDPSVFPPADPVTIAVTSLLPWLSQGQVTIDASNAGVIVDGSATPAGTHGLVIASDGNTIQGLQILHFPGNGINVQDGAHNRIGGDRLLGSGSVGQGHLLSGNGWDGVALMGAGTMSNTVIGNLIGTDLSGEQILGNGDGVRIGSGASHKVVGGQTPGERNVASGNRNNQIELWGAGTEYNVVQGNLIGTDASGTRALRDLSPTGGSGVSLHSGARCNVIGPGNIIAGVAFGVAIGLDRTNDNTVTGNLIGTDLSGTGAIGNYYHGISVSGGAQRNQVGPANRIAHSGSLGVQVQGAATLSNTITANAIYANAGKGIANEDGGNASLPPPIIATATVTTVIGTAPASATVEIFSDREDEGRVYEGQVVAMPGGAFTFTKPAGLTGPHVTATATDAAGNTSEFSAPVLAVLHGGVITVTSTLNEGPGSLRQAILDAWPGDTITFDPAVFPPTSPATISLQSDLPPITQGHITIDGSNAGIVLDGSNIPPSTTWPYAYGQGGLTLRSAGNVIMGLQIINFPAMGVLVEGDGNVIGGDRGRGSGPLGQGNLVSGNGANGIHIASHESNVVIGNLIGTDVTGTREFGNGECGVQISSPRGGNRIGGMNPRDRNVLSGNRYAGLQMLNTSGNLVIGNYVGTDVSGSVSLSNHLSNYGITMEIGSFSNRVQGNLVSGNGAFGIYIGDWGSDYNTVVGNRVGTDASGTKAIPNNDGVVVTGGPSFNRIGGFGPGEANLISGNRYSGLLLEPSSGPGNLVIGNWVGTTSDGAGPLGNGRQSGGSAGISLNTYDVMSIAEGNLSSGNLGPGLGLYGDYNFAIGNHIGTDIRLTRPLPNDGAGIQVRGEHNLAQANLVAYSRTAPGIAVYVWPYNSLRRNSIFGNAGPGIVLSDGGNQMLPTPIILTVAETTVTGTACPGCTIEVFSDDEDEGRIYEGTAIADATGHFAFDKGSPLAGPYVTATATDGQGNTSEFSAPAARRVKVYLPLALKKHVSNTGR